MNYFEVRSGDLFDQPDLPAVGQGVNVFGVMGAGIAAAFRQREPQMVKPYQAECEAGNLVPGTAWLYQSQDESTAYRWIANCASQRMPGADASAVWLRDSLIDAIRQLREENVDTLGVPLIGGGIGGLTPTRVVHTLQEVAEEQRFRIVLVVPEGH